MADGLSAQRVELPGPSTPDVVVRLRSEFLEMPGLQLTVTQVQRLCGISASSCRDALDVLVDAKFLCIKSNGCYARLTDGGYISGHSFERSGKSECR